jgi:hypothetical protein
MAQIKIDSQFTDEKFTEQLSVNLTESSATLLKTMAVKTGLPQAQLGQFWDLAVQKNTQKTQNKDPAFWGGVMKDFQSLLDKVDIEQARNIMETREQFKQSANEFLNHLASDEANYIEAEKAFKTMGAARLQGNIEEKAEKYCQTVLSQEAKKLSRDL